MAFTLPLTFGATKSGQPGVMDGDVIEVEENCPEIGIASVEETMRPTDSEEQDDESAKRVLTKPSEGMSPETTVYFCTLRWQTTTKGSVLVDNGAAVSRTDSRSLIPKLLNGTAPSPLLNRSLSSDTIRIRC